MQPWVDCVSPASHAAFRTPIEMMKFIDRLRDLSGGKPTGFKLCIGHPWEWFAIAKAMVATGITPADRLLARYHGEWQGDLSHIYEEFSF